MQRDSGALFDGVIAFIFLASLAQASELSVVNCNLAKTDALRVQSELEQIQQLRDADLYLLQEAEDPGIRDMFNGRLPYRANHAAGLAVLSRFPIVGERIISLPVYDLKFKKTRRVAQVVTLGTPRGSLCVINVHLDNRLNTDQKLEQLRPILAAAAEFSGPVLVGGDFNTGNFYWVNHVLPLPYAQDIRRAVVGSMRANGFETPFGDAPTFDFLRLRLDWIFLRGPRAISSGVARLRFSDHHALWMRMAMP